MNRKNNKNQNAESMQEKNKKSKHIGLKIFLLIFILAIAGIAVYMFTPYKASENALELLTEEGMADENNITITTNSDKGYIVVAPKSAMAGLIFYPGGRVEYDAYLPLCYSFAQKGITCIIVDMPLNFAVFDMDAAEGICEDFPEIESWYIGGHSLGGAMAASYVSQHLEEYEGLVLLGSYSTADLSESGLKVLVSYGTSDGVINRGNYQKNISNLPEGTKELIIVGGCHSYFGDYGEQSGDGHPSISREEQIEYVTEAFYKLVTE